MNPYIEILRPLNCLMAGFAVLIGVNIAGANIAREISPMTILTFFLIFIICGAGNAINDYFDYEIDKINKPMRPIPSGRIPLKNAYIYSMFLFTLAAVVSIYIHPYAFLLVALNSALLYLYAWKIKKVGGLLKNLTVSVLVASPFLYGGIIVGNILPTFLLSLMAGLVNMSREIAKDIEDYEGDKKFVVTFPAQVSFKISAIFVAIFIIIAIFISILPYLLRILDWGYMVLVGIADVFLLYATAEFLRNMDAKKMQVRIKLGMILALAAFLLSSL